jgi:hypothetical protein
MFVEERLPITLRFGCIAKTDLIHVRHCSKEVHLPVGNGASDSNVFTSKGFSSLSMFTVPSLSASKPVCQTYWPVLLSFSIREFTVSFVFASAAKLPKIMVSNHWFLRNC